MGFKATKYRLASVRWSPRPVSRPCQDLAHPLDKFGLGPGELGALAQFQIVSAVLGRLCKLRAELQIADRDLRAAGRVAFVRSLDDGDAALAPVRIFELRVHLALAEIQLGRDPG